MNAVFAGIVLALIPMFVTISSASPITEEEKYTTVVNFFESITNTYAYLGDTTKMQSNNKPSGPHGDIVTASGGLFTVYAIAQGWPAVMCKPGESPNVVGSSCFVGEGVVLKNALIYSAGVKDVDEDTSTSFSINEKRIVLDNLSRKITLSLRIRVEWTQTVCDSSSSDNSGTTTKSSILGLSGGNKKTQQFKLLRLSSSSSGSSGGSSSSGSDGPSESHCSTSNGTWQGWLSQTIPTPKEFSYNKTQNMTYNNSFLVKLANTPLTKEEYGFGMEGYVPSYSKSDILKGILMKNVTQKNESVNIALSYYEKYYKISWDERRQIYYGELINVSNPPKIETNRARIFYDYSNKTVSSVQMDNSTVLRDFWVMSPFGRKNVTVNVIETKEADFVGDSIVLISILLALSVVFFAAKPLITGR